MHHCFGGTFPGAYKVDFDPVQAVRQWKATGKAPDQIVVETSGDGWPTRKRLVCAYPKVSAYKGSGDVAIRRTSPVRRHNASLRGCGSSDPPDSRRVTAAAD